MKIDNSVSAYVHMAPPPPVHICTHFECPPFPLISEVLNGWPMDETKNRK